MRSTLGQMKENHRRVLRGEESRAEPALGGITMIWIGSQLVARALSLAIASIYRLINGKMLEFLYFPYIVPIPTKSEL